MKKLCILIAVCLIALEIPALPAAAEVTDATPLAPSSDTTVPLSGMTLAAATSDGQSVSIASRAAAAARRFGGTSSTRVRDVASGGVSYDVIPDNDGFAVLIDIPSRGAEHSHAFQIGMPDGAMLEATDDGSVDVVGTDGATIGSFDRPWAKDANGADIATWFDVQGDTLIQTVDAGDAAVYPIVADPHYTWGWVTGTVYFNKFETSALCSTSGTAIWWIVTSAFWLPIALAAAVYIAATSCTAVVFGQCLKLKSTGVVGLYSGGYCT